MTQTAAPKMTAADKRFAFIQAITAPLQDAAKARLVLQQSGMDPDLVPDLGVDALTEIIEKMRTEGPSYGRTTRWHNACTWAAYEIANQDASGEPVDQSFARWAVVQGAVWMGYAAE